MCCTMLSILNEVLEEEKACQYNDYFASLIGGASNHITISKVANAIGDSPDVVRKVLGRLVKSRFMSMTYAIWCPECGTVIKKIDSLGDINSEKIYCYKCEEDVDITFDDVQVIYSLNSESVFSQGQQEYIDNYSAHSVVRDDTLYSLLLTGDINDYFFHPTEDEYNKLSVMAADVRANKKNTNLKGTALEQFTEYLFGLTKIFKTTTKLTTSTNQIDCCVRNKMYVEFGVFHDLGLHFYIECKNENETPSGGYMSKLESIINVYNAGTDGTGMKFGIIISKKKGPSTFLELAKKYYLMQKVVIISICLDELEVMIKKKENLLDLIEMKIFQIKSDATIDLKKEGLY